MKKGLFALLIGVNEYKSDKIRKLRGCAADVENVKKYLIDTYQKGQFEWNPETDIKILTNSDATKKNILTAFRKHLGKAKKGDVIMFYFSGHGMREKTDIGTFREDEFDGNLAGLVCHDTNPFEYPNPDRSSLSDKELRYWIRTLAEDEAGQAKATVVTLFDCCHSGENTRDALGGDRSLRPTAADCSRRIHKKTFPSRTWDGFHFGNDAAGLQAKISAGAALGTVLPEAAHIQFAACREIELAFEFPPDAMVRKGVFTTALLEILRQSEGQISYDELHHRIRQRAPHHNTPGTSQHPQMYIPPSFQTLRYLNFLTHEAPDSPLKCGVISQGGDRSLRPTWKITAGALRGIPIPKKENDTIIPQTQVNIFANNGGQPIATAEVTEVEVDHSTIQLISGELNPDITTYYAQIPGLGVNPIRIWVQGPDEKGKTFVKAELGKHLESHPGEPGFSLVPSRIHADFVLTLRKGGVFVSHSADLQDRVLFQHINLVEQQVYRVEGIHELIHRLSQINSWTFLQKLNHAEKVDFSRLIAQEHVPKDANMFPVELRLFILDEDPSGQIIERKLTHTHGVYLFDLINPEESQKKYTTLDPGKRYFRMEVINHSPGPRDHYFCSLLYLTNRFGVYTNLMTQPTLLLGSTEKTMSSQGRKLDFLAGTGLSEQKYLPIDLTRDAHLKDDNWPAISYYFKLIVSRKDFDVNKLSLKSIPPPGLKSSGDDKALRASTLKIRKNKFDIPKIQWEIHTFELLIQNPDYRLE